MSDDPLMGELIERLPLADPAELEKIAAWTVPQFAAWLRLLDRSGIDWHGLMAQTSYQPRPGIGAIYNPTVLGVRLNGIFVGIETDGYTHS